MQPPLWLNAMVFLQDACILLSFILFLRLRRPLIKEYAVLGTSIFLCFITEINSLIFYQLEINPNKANAVLALGINTLFALVYKQMIREKWFDVTIYIWIGVSIVFSVINYIWIQGPEVINSYSAVSINISFAIFSIIYFYKLMHQLPYMSIMQLPWFWINSSLLLYYSGTFILNLFTTYIVQKLQLNYIPFYVLQIVLTYLHFLLLGYALILIHQNDKAELLQLGVVSEQNSNHTKVEGTP